MQGGNERTDFVAGDHPSLERREADALDRARTIERGKNTQKEKRGAALHLRGVRFRSNLVTIPRLGKLRRDVYLWNSPILESCELSLPGRVSEVLNPIFGGKLNGVQTL